MARRHRSVWGSAQERRGADRFFADLLNGSAAQSLGEGSSEDFFGGFGEGFSPRQAESVSPESGPRSSGSSQPLEHFEQWVANSVASDAGRRPAPLGPAWVRARLQGSNKPGEVTAAATELRRLDGQRVNRSGTDFRVDTAQSRVLAQASANLLPVLERLDTTAATAASCSRTFATTAALATRKDYWRTQIDNLATTNQTVLINWIIGKQTFSGNSTVQSATREAKAQVDCMRTAINTARRSASSMADPLSRSPTRDFSDQQCIWVWKYFFAASRSGLGSLCSRTSATYKFGSMTSGAVTTATAAMPSSRSHFTAGGEWDPVGSGAQARAHRTAWTTHLSSDQRQREILQTSSAPGISRHHWGSDVDLGSTTGSDWLSGGHLELYRWLQANALSFGITQVYTPDRPGYTSAAPLSGYAGYIEERWHWSYYPVAQALLEWAQQPAKKALILAALQAAWGDLRTSSTHSAARTSLGWGSSTNPFSYIETHWETFFFNVNRFVTPPVV